uniref:tRNA (guanine-N(7)-)-methyltransferase n=1 Tax=Roseihalotalea indica TaxID=2867963 RepID=A0AA49JDV4_9BACT|nr:tRNA (guanosine(46)-N7)-methyltransferase TrmB [Tunicatimonas sp. TK19036]
MRNKLERFAENAERRNVVEPGKPVFLSIKGHWGEFFENDYPMTLELGCGHGEYTVGLAAMYPQRNFIGVDVKGARIWKGSSQAEEQGLSNVAFLRIRILDLEESVAEAETSEIWITFPDPRPKDRDEKRRLTAPRFLDMYKRVLQPGGRVHLKTDNAGLFEYTLEQVKLRSDISDLDFTDDLYQSDLYESEQQILTTFEKKFKARGQSIKYLRFRFQ